MGRRRIPREPEVKVAVRVATKQPVWFEWPVVAAIAALAAGVAGLSWLALAPVP